MNEEPFALLITWTCYGTWLPGDERGHVSNSLLPEGGFHRKENIPHTPCAGGDEYTRRRARSLQRGSTTFLSQAQALVAANALVAAAQKRGWRIVRGAVMTNHVHVVVMNCPDDGEAVRRILKGNSQAALSDKEGQSRRWWTAGGSDRYKHGWPAIDAATEYVAQQPGMLVEIIDMKVEISSERRG